MSNVVSGIAQKRVIGSSARKSVLMLMAACASDDGKGIWTSKANMASDLEMSKRTVQKAITDMMELGVIFVAGKRPCKNGYTIEYGINIGALSALKCTRAADAPVQQMHPTRAADAPQDVQQMHPNHTGTVHEPSNTPIVPNSSFDDFWEVVPKKGDKPDARVAWAKAVKKTDPSKIISAMRAYAKSRQGEDPQYTIYPHRWLKKERWNNDPPTAKGPKTDDFHNQFSKMLGGQDDGLQRENEIDSQRAERISSQV